MGMLNAFTIDVEDWFHVCDVDNKESKFDNWNKCENRVVVITLLLLKILREHDTKAPFFFTPMVEADLGPPVSRISSSGRPSRSAGPIPIITSATGFPSLSTIRPEMSPPGLSTISPRGAVSAMGISIFLS